MKAVEKFLRQAGWLVIVETFILMLAIGFVDFVTGWELSVFILYAVPIAIITWKEERTLGVIFAAVSTVIWWFANLTNHPYTTYWGYLIATFTRFFYLAVVAIGTAALKARQELDRERIAGFEHTRELEEEIVRASEEVQQRIGRDLHDGLCQFLAGTALVAHSLAEKLEAQRAPESENARKLQGLIGDAARQAREIAHGAFTVPTGPEGLPTALDELASTSAKLFEGIAVRFLNRGDFSNLAIESANHLYRIAQEALSNAIRHGKARNVTIELYGDEEGLVLTVSSDGKAFDGNASSSSGMGLKSMHYRAHALGGMLAIAEGQDGGSEVTCIVTNLARTGRAAVETPYGHES
ncbi:MAG: ATP-binding protein [Chthoniobacteraceae bacterium]